MAPGEPVLLICNWFPPNAGIGGRRWAKFAKELARRGHPVHVIRSAGRPGTLNSLWTADVQHPNIIHHTMPARFPAVMTRWPLTSLRDKLQYRYWLRVLPLRTKGNYFDLGSCSRKDLLRIAQRLIGEQGIRQVIVTGAPFSLMVYAAELREQFPGLHMVADFRDIWTWGTDYGFGLIGAKRQAHERAMEALVARTYDKLISPHPHVTAHLEQAYGGPSSRYGVLPHAVDPDEMAVDPPAREAAGFRMIYAGSFYGAAEADHYFEVLLQAFEALRDGWPDAFASCRLDLYITGQGTGPLAEKVQQRGLGQQVRFHPPLPPKDVFQQLAAADLIINFIPSMNKHIMGTKFNEVFFLGCPILHVGEPGLVSRTIQERRMGDSLRVEELVAELPRIISGERKVEIDREADHSAYLLANITDQLIEDVLD